MNLTLEKNEPVTDLLDSPWNYYTHNFDTIAFLLGIFAWWQNV